MTEEKPTIDNETTPVPTGDPEPAPSEDVAAGGETASAAAPEDPNEPILTWEKLGPQFDIAITALKPLRIIAETQRGDRATYFRNFKGHRLEKFNRKRMIEILRKEIFGRKNLFLAQLTMVLWNDTKKDLYNAIHKHVSSIDENVESIVRIDDHKAHEIMNDLLARGFSRDDIHICVCINDVRFSPEFVTNHVAPRSFAEEEATE